MIGVGRWWNGAWLAVTAAMLATGCTGSVNMLAVPYFLMFGAEPTVPPRVELVKGRKDKKKVLVLCYAEPGLKFGFDSIDDSLCGLVIGELARTEPRLEVVPERKVREWADVNPNWQAHGLGEIGERFDVDYVLSFEVVGFQLNETKNQFLLKGSARILVEVHDVDENKRLFQGIYEREYPPHRAVPLADVRSEEHFRDMFLRTIARELTWYVLPHRMHDEPLDL
jgi:hypothetical protein